MRGEIKQKKPGKKERDFGILMAVVLTAIALLFYWRGKSAPLPYLLAIAGFFFAAAVIYPLILNPIYRVWMAFSAVIGWVNTRILMLVFFFVVITPIALLMRLFGRDVLKLKFSRKKNTYWVKKKRKRVLPEQYERQF